MIQGETDKSHLRAFLTDRDIPCPVCRYNLRGLPSTSCPECGAQLDLRVGSIDLKLGPWLLCVLATAIPTGFNGILSTIGTIGAISSAYWDSTDWLQLAAFIGLTVAFGSALAIVVRRRSRFLRKTTAAQWRRAWILVVIMAGVQALTIWGLYVLM
ncbi:MAG: hypothetical protein IIB53_09755 [Planctomycetes bacterium]|nr:hypothetical protein [Planctomycetota bacterium]MCH8259237.1 hypothetical protein [Planctomycetota bacterium]